MSEVTGQCGECNLFVPLDGVLLAAHGFPPCPGGGDYPMRPGPRLAYASGSAFESCPAATGQMSPDNLFACRHFPDGAHRCGEVRGHTNHSPGGHRCTCGTSWTPIYAPEGAQ